MSPEELLAEFEDLERGAPTLDDAVISGKEVLAWFGRLSAVTAEWNSLEAIHLGSHISNFYLLRGAPRGKRGLGDATFQNCAPSYNNVMILLHRARHDLRMKTVGPLSISLTDGKVFDYFDEIRKIVEVARQDLLFVDPYLGAEFVSRYLPHVATGVRIRLLAGRKLLTLLPAVDAFMQQTQGRVEVRSAALHDRYLFVDRTNCYQSGASFKDGAKKTPTTLTQITDVFTAVFQTYEDIWNKATVER